MKILGIDPGFHRCGYGIIRREADRITSVEHGLITTPPQMPMAGRLLELELALDQLIARHRPDALAVEQVFFEKNRKTFARVSQALGVILVTGARAKLPVCEYTPLQVKQALTGYGRAAKPQVQRMVKLILGIGGKIAIDDTADALAIAITHAHTLRSNAKYQIPNRK